MRDISDRSQCSPPSVFTLRIKVPLHSPFIAPLPQSVLECILTSFGRRDTVRDTCSHLAIHSCAKINRRCVTDGRSGNSKREAPHAKHMKCSAWDRIHLLRCVFTDATLGPPANAGTQHQTPQHPATHGDADTPLLRLPATRGR